MTKLRELKFLKEKKEKEKSQIHELQNIPEKEITKPVRTRNR